jgi:hypothetical protein
MDIRSDISLTHQSEGLFPESSSALHDEIVLNGLGDQTGDRHLAVSRSPFQIVAQFIRETDGQAHWDTPFFNDLAFRSLIS